MRNHWWDWLKLLAAWAMLCDHLRFVDPQLASCFWLGRIAFPLFGVVAAENFRATVKRENYVLKLLFWGALSEWPFQALTGQTGNILLLFAFGFSAFHWKWIFPILGAACCAYGLQGGVALVMWCFGGSRSILAVLGGLVVNPLPFAWISGAASMLPGCVPDVGPAPFARTTWLWWFYPAHLVALIFLKEIL